MTRLAPSQRATASKTARQGDRPDAYRNLLETGSFAKMIAGDAPGLRILSEEERAASLGETLAQRPVGDVWIFAYGSLIWNPAIHVVETRLARVEGWHRSFCLSSFAGRGSPSRPGLALALDEGGICEGVALRILEANLENELALVWRREMVVAGYIPIWIDVTHQTGKPFAKALTFMIDKTSSNYAGDLSQEAIVQRLATASGSLGSSADYLFRTRDQLRAKGIPDDELEQLAAEVEDAIGEPLLSAQIAQLVCEE